MNGCENLKKVSFKVYLLVALVAQLYTYNHMFYSFYFSLIISVIIFHTFGQIYNYYPIYNPYLTTNSIIFSAPIEWLHAKQIGRKLLISWVPPFFSLKTCPTSKLVFEINTFLQQRQR